MIVKSWNVTHFLGNYQHVWRLVTIIIYIFQDGSLLLTSASWSYPLSFLWGMKSVFMMKWVMFASFHRPHSLKITIWGKLYICKITIRHVWSDCFPTTDRVVLFSVFSLRQSLITLPPYINRTALCYEIFMLKGKKMLFNYTHQAPESCSQFMEQALGFIHLHSLIS